MTREERRTRIARRTALELRDGDVVNLGIGLPTLVTDYVPPGVRLTLHSENGIIGTCPVTEENRDVMHVVDAGGAPAAVGPGGCFVDSAFSFAFMRGGHIDVAVIGALEVDREGSLASWLIPGVKMPGMGGAMDLLAGARRVVVAMEHTAGGAPKILERCTLPLTAVGCVDRIITEMAVIDVMPGGLVLAEYHPDFPPERIQAATGAALALSPALRPMAGV